MNNNDGTRSFEPIQPEKDEKKIQTKPDAKKIVSIAIFAVVIAIVLLFCAVIITKIVYKATGGVEKVNGKIQFTEVSLSSSNKAEGDLVLIDGSHKLGGTPIIVESIKTSDAPYKVSTSTSYPSDKLKANAAAALKKMADELYSEKSVRFIVAYAYHSTPKDACDAEHVVGTVVDLKQIDDTETYTKFESGILSWLNQNCAKFGFINSFPNGGHDETSSQPSTQFRYVGVAHATYIATEGITFAQYLSEIKEYTYNKPLNITGADGNSYAIYYVAATGDTTTVKVPSNYNYEISGNNTDGFIVTVMLSEVVE